MLNRVSQWAKIKISSLEHFFIYINHSSMNLEYIFILDWHMLIVHGVFCGPLFRHWFVLLSVGFVESSDIWDQRIVWVWIGEHWTNWEENFWDCESGTPLTFKNIKTNGSGCVYIWVVDFSGELHFRRLEWVICRKMYQQTKNTTWIWRVLWSCDSSLPFKQIVANRSGWTLRRWVPSDIFKFLGYSF